MSFDRLRALGFSPVPWAYAILALASALLLQQIFSNQGVTRVQVVIPILVVAVILTRWNVLEALIPPIVLACVGGLGVMGRLFEDPGQQTLLAGATLVLFASLTRYQSWFRNAEPLGMTTRFNYTPATSVPRARPALPLGAVMAFVLLPLAWLASGWLCSELLQLSSDHNLALEYKYELQQTIGLDIPEVYLGMKLLFTLAITFWVTKNVLDYFCFRRDGDELAAMHLRSELWRWNGREQRLVSKQIRKNPT